MLLQYLLLNDDFSRHIGLFTEWDYLAPPFWRRILRLELDLGLGLGIGLGLWLGIGFGIGLRLGLGLEFGTNDFLKTAEPKQRRLFNSGNNFSKRCIFVSVYGNI